MGQPNLTIAEVAQIGDFDKLQALMYFFGATLLSEGEESTWNLMKMYLKEVHIEKGTAYNADSLAPVVMDSIENDNFGDELAQKTLPTKRVSTNVKYNYFRIPINRQQRIDLNFDRHTTVIEAMRNSMDSRNIHTVLTALGSHNHSYFIDREGRLSGEEGASLTSGTAVSLSKKFVRKMTKMVHKWGNTTDSEILFICNPKVLSDYREQKDNQYQCKNGIPKLDSNISALPLPDFDKGGLVASGSLFNSYGISARNVSYLTTDNVNIKKFYDVSTNSDVIRLDYFNGCIVGADNNNKGLFVVQTKDTQ